MGQGESKTSSADNSADASRAIAVTADSSPSSVAETNQKLAESYSKTLRQVEGVVHRMQQEKVDETNSLKNELEDAKDKLKKMEDKKNYYKEHLKARVGKK